MTSVQASLMHCEAIKCVYFKGKLHSFFSEKVWKCNKLKQDVVIATTVKWNCVVFTLQMITSHKILASDWLTIFQWFNCFAFFFNWMQQRICDGSCFENCC